MAIRGKNPAFHFTHSTVDFLVAVLGNTTNAPTLPADGVLTAATSTFPVSVNMVSHVAAEAPTRTSAGLYVVTYSQQLIHVYPVGASVVAAGGSPTASGLEVTIISVVPATRKVTCLVTVPGTSGGGTDAGVNDMIILALRGVDSTSPA